jgi:hypothetical protein
LILITTLWPLRAMKGLMIALQYHHQAAEGRPSDGDPHDGDPHGGGAP